MTRRAGTTGTSRDPYGLGPAGTYVAPAIAGLALVIVAAITLSLMNGQVPFHGGSNGPGTQPGPNRTPAPSNQVIVEPSVTFAGSIVYAKAGNVWVQTGNAARQLTNSGLDSMPSFSPDGQWVYFIRVQVGKGLHPLNGRLTWYDLATPEIARVKTDGSAKPEQIVTGRIKSGKSTWFSWMREPVLGPDGHTVALVSDGPDPSKSEVVLQFYDLTSKKFTKPKLSAADLGHQDPAWEPLGRYVAFVKNGRDGSRGAPQIVKYNPENGRSFAVTGPGYLAPSWSPDTKYLAATKTDSFGTNVAILDANTGAELLRVTNDGASFSPVWSPAGDAIAFLHLEGMIVDLRMVKLEGSAGSWTVGDAINLTEVSGLDAASRPGWFIPPGEMPAGTAPPSGSGSSSASPAP